jgi:hypothetical protein
MRPEDYLLNNSNPVTRVTALTEAINCLIWENWQLMSDDLETYYGELKETNVRLAADNLILREKVRVLEEKLKELTPEENTNISLL